MLSGHAQFTLQDRHGEQHQLVMLLCMLEVPSGGEV